MREDLRAANNTKAPSLKSQRRFPDNMFNYNKDYLVKEVEQQQTLWSLEEMFERHSEED